MAARRVTWVRRVLLHGWTREFRSVRPPMVRRQPGNCVHLIFRCYLTIVRFNYLTASVCVTLFSFCPAIGCHFYHLEIQFFLTAFIERSVRIQWALHTFTLDIQWILFTIHFRLSNSRLSLYRRVWLVHTMKFMGHWETRALLSLPIRFSGPNKLWSTKVQNESLQL